MTTATLRNNGQKRYLTADERRHMIADIRHQFEVLKITPDQQRANIEALAGTEARLTQLLNDQLATLSDSLKARIDSAEAEEPEPDIDKQVHEAFDYVALGAACTLPMLLDETRKRGVDDDDVLEVLSNDETLLSFHMGNDKRFRCCRNDRGDLFIERDSGVNARLASAYELFAEVKRQELAVA